MRSIEEKIQAAFEIGRVAGAAETLKDEQTRDCIFGSAQAVFDGMMEEAIEDEKKREEELGEACQHALFADEPTEVSIMKAGKQTNFDRITASTAAMAQFMNDEIQHCPPGEENKVCDEKCTACWIGWLRKEAAE